MEEGPNLIRFTIELGNKLSKNLDVGSSLSVDGVCLSAVRVAGSRATFEVIKETQNRTTLADIAPGRRVNIERSISVSDEIGGHLVSGHIDGMARVRDVQQRQNERILKIHARPEWMKYIFSKGFIALDGASLTVVAVDRPRSTFTVHLIPETLRSTVFSSKTRGSSVNLEIDRHTQAIVDTVERILHERDAEPALA